MARRARLPSPRRGAGSMRPRPRPTPRPEPSTNAMPAAGSTNPTRARQQGPPLGTQKQAPERIEPQTIGPQKDLQAGYLMCIPEIAREITSCWISAVPSKMS